MALSAGVTVKVAISPPIAAREPRQRSTAREDGHPQSRNTTGIIGKPVLENAIRHTPLGAHIAVTADPVGSIVVEDDGPGLRDDLVPDLLQPFKKGAASSDGAGLGLAIVKQRSPTWHVGRPASRSGFEPPERGGCVA
jgi:Histidine kinase-, DNA gyrase B-, and HSP90-like ATPase